mmetsp:Transcript_6389/g.19785  ORF Transcript_6389/g.19785 Transcript_6389/m.19785 type:complete len:267 (-) Transcript_6389:12-812(-)
MLGDVGKRHQPRALRPCERHQLEQRLRLLPLGLRRRHRLRPSRLVAHRPRDYARAAAVSRQQLGERARRLRLPLLHDGGRVGEGQSDAGRLGDDQQAVLVGEVEVHLRVRVVRGAVRVGADPPQARVVAHKHGANLGAPHQREIFVPAKPAHRHGLAVEEEAVVRRLDSPQSKPLLVRVNRGTVGVQRLEAKAVQVRGAGRPQSRPQHAHGAARLGRLRIDCAVGGLARLDAALCPEARSHTAHAGPAAAAHYHVGGRGGASGEAL